MENLEYLESEFEEEDDDKNKILKKKNQVDNLAKLEGEHMDGENILSDLLKEKQP